MKTSIRHHTDGTPIITFVAENSTDCHANLLLYARYDGTGLIGSASGIGQFIDLIIVPLTPEEIRQNAEADASIVALNAKASQFCAKIAVVA